MRRAAFVILIIAAALIAAALLYSGRDRGIPADVSEPSLPRSADAPERALSSPPPAPATSSAPAETIPEETTGTVTTIPAATAAPRSADAGNSGTINGRSIDLGANAGGYGWMWSAADRVLYLTGGRLDAVEIDSDGDMSVVVTNDAHVKGIIKKGEGALTINVREGKTLTSETDIGQAVAADGDVLVESGNLSASTSDSAAAIESQRGSVTIAGDANVTASSNGGSGLKGAEDVNIGTSGVVSSTAAGAGYSIEAGGSIVISNGTVNLYADRDVKSASAGANADISEKAKVSVNDRPLGTGGGIVPRENSNVGCSSFHLPVYMLFLIILCPRGRAR